MSDLEGVALLGGVIVVGVIGYALYTVIQGWDPSTWSINPPKLPIQQQSQGQFTCGATEFFTRA